MKTPVKIRVDASTRETLKNLGRKGETYDAVIRRLMKIHTQGVDPRQWKERWNLENIEEEVKE